MLFLLILHCFVLLKCIACENVNIAGLFEDEPTQEKAFSFAIDLANNHAEDDFTFIPHINNHLTKDDPFRTLRKLCTLLDSGVVAVFGPSSPTNKAMVQSVCDLKEIPHVTTKWNGWPVRHETGISLYPHAPILAEAYFDVIVALGWKTFTVLYEDDESFLRVAGLVARSKDRGVLVQVMQLDESDEKSYRTTIKALKLSGQQYIVLDCRFQSLAEILKQLQQAGLVNENFHYFVTNLDTHTEDLTPFMFSNVQMTGIRLINPNAEYTQRVSTELFAGSELAPSWKLRTEAALLVDAVQMFSNTLRNRQRLSPIPIVKTDDAFPCTSPKGWEHGLSIINMMKTSNHEGLTGLVAFNNEGYRSDFNLHVFELREGGITDVGNWNSSKGVNIDAAPQSQSVTDGDSLRNMSFNVLITLTEPYGMLKMTAEQQIGNDRFEGYGIDLIQKLAEMEGFNYTFLVREDKKNGAFDGEKWTGMIGDLLEYKADLAICDFTITSDRQEAVDFTVPFMTLGVSILFKEPVNAPPSFFSFADPFGLDTWVALGGSFFVVAFALYFMGRLCSDEWTNPYPCIEEPKHLTNQFSLANAVWFATGSLLLQGSEIGPIAVSTRMGAGMWWYFCLIMSASYTANLAAFLATQNPVELFTDLQSLYDNPHGIKFGAKENGATLKFFTEAEPGTILRKIGDFMKEHPANVKENDEGVLRAESETEKYAFFMESTSIEYATQRHCTLRQYGGLLDEKGYGIAMRKNSSYRTRLNSALLQLQMSHVLDDLKKKWWEDRRGGGACGGGVASTDAVPLGMMNVEGCFFVTVYGTLLALILVVVEHLWFVRKISRSSKMSFGKVFMLELKAFLDFNNATKPNMAMNKSLGGDVGNKESGDSSKSKSGERAGASSRCCSTVHSRSRSRSSSVTKAKSRKSKTSRSSGRKTPVPYGFVVPRPDDEMKF